MIEQIVWSRRAEKAYSKIIDYVLSDFGVRRAKKHANDVYKEVGKLKSNQELGQIEPWLVGSNYEFRHLVIGKLTKVIYRITVDRIEIVDVWDTRQNPEELAARILE